MGLRTEHQYFEGLRDGRTVFYQGHRVPDVTEHDALGLAARHAAIDFRLAEDPAHRDLLVYEDDGSSCSAYFRIPEGPGDLSARSGMIQMATAEGGTLVPLVKEIGTDALFALMLVLREKGEQELLVRLMNFYRECREGDLTLAVAQTDVKGNRSKRPSQQDDPDTYLRVVDERADGIVVRGAKVHTSCAPYVDWLIVIPTRAMAEGEEAWSVAFAVPVDTPGLKLYASDFMHDARDSFSHPVSSVHRMVETLTVFEDVFVPWEQVFFVRRPDLSGLAALSFVDFHRFTAVSYKIPLLDALVGCAVGLARANGIEQASHVRDKLTWLCGYVETVRGLLQLSATRAVVSHGVAVPDVMTTNLAKWTFAREFHRAIGIVQDLAGGLLVTGPSGEDWRSEEVRRTLEKYLVGAWPAEPRIGIMNLASELTSGSYAGYQAVLATHAEGSIEAEKLAMYRALDVDSAVEYAVRLSGIGHQDGVREDGERGRS